MTTLTSRNGTDKSARFAPVAIFAYRRAFELGKLLDSLAACPEATETALTIFVDGPKGAREAKAVQAVLDVAYHERRFCSIEVVASSMNRGLSNSIISGVNRMLSQNDEVIVLEDDLVVSESFLRFMNDGLNAYRAVPEVVSIHGYVYPLGVELDGNFFLRGADCWGWATWKDSWRLFEPDSKKLLKRLVESGQESDFNFGGAFNYVGMLQDQIAGRVDSWAIRWYASAFLEGRLTLYPRKSLVMNTGLNRQGTHGGNPALWGLPNPGTVEAAVLEVKESSLARRAFEQFFRQLNLQQETLLNRVMRNIRLWVSKSVS